MHHNSSRSSSARQEESHLPCCPRTCSISLYGWPVNFIFLLQTQANQICMFLTLLVLPSPKLGKQLLQKQHQTSNCMTHPLKRESKSFCVNNCIINKSSFFSKLLTFWVKPLPGVTPLSSVNLHEKKSGPHCLETEAILPVHLSHSLENCNLVSVCVCVYNIHICASAHARVCMH